MTTTDSKWKASKHFSPADYAGFCYMITFPDGSWYVGRKQFWSTTRKKVPGKTKRKVTKKESDWRTYCSSSEYVKAKLVDCPNPQWEILELCKTKRELGYWETYNIITRRKGIIDPLALNKQCPAIRQFP